MDGNAEVQTLFPARSYCWCARADLDVNSTQVLAPVGGRAVPLADVPDPVFSAGMVGHGAAIDPPREVIDADVAPVSGKLLKLMPHAYIVHDARTTSEFSSTSGWTPFR